MRNSGVITAGCIVLCLRGPDASSCLVIVLGKSLYSVCSFLHPGIWLNTSEVLRKLIEAGEG